MENEKADTSADADKKVVLKDFVLEYSLEGAGSLNIGALTLSLFGLEGGDNAGHTKRIAEAVWEDDRVIELHPGISDLTIVAQSEGAGDLGFLFLPKDDLLEFLRVEHDLKEVERNFEIGGHPGKLTITFTVGLSHNVNADINIGPSGEPRHQTQSLSTATPGNSLETPSLFNAIGHRFMQQFAATNNIDDINKACSNYDLAVQLAEPDGAGYGLYLADSAFGLFGRFRLLKEITDINRAISTMEAAVACTSEGDVDLPGRLNNCGSLFRARFEHNGDPQDLKSAILCQQRAVQSTHDEDPDLPMLVNQLGDSFKMCFECTGDLVDIENAILNQQMALQLVGEENHNFPVWLSNLGASFRCRFQRTGEREDIDTAVRNQEAAVRLVPAQPGLLNNLGNSLLLYFEVTGDLTDIDNAISNQLKAVELVSENDSNLPSFLSNLGASYLTRFDFKGDLQDAKSAILYQQRAVKLFPEGHPNLPGLLNNLGSMLVAQFNHTGDLEDISNAIAHQQRAVQLTPAGHANLPGFLGNLGNSFEIRFRRSGRLEDIDSAISNQQVAIQLTPTNHSNLPTLLCSIGYSFITRSRSTGDSMDIESAIAHQQRAVQLTPKSHATASSQFLSSLGLSFAFRFERTGDPDDIENAISYQQKAVELTPESHSSLPLRLGDLGVALRIRFERFGDLVDIERAISNQQRAVNITPQGHAALPGQLANLSASFAARFMRTGALVDIERAIATQEQAIEYMPTGHIELPVHLNNLGNSFLNRFRIKSDLQDVESALANQERAVQLTPEGHPRLAAWYNNLGNSFRTRFWRTRELPDIERAISYHQRAVDLTAEGNVYLPIWLTCLGNSFGTRFEHTEDLRDIETAISHQQRAVDITPDGHAGLPLFLHNLADSFRLRFAISKDEQDILQAISVWRRAATQNVGHPSTRLDSARRWAMLSEEHNGPDTLEAFRVAIGLLSQVAGLEQTIHSRHKSLVDMSDLTASATAAAFAHGALEDALAWLEQGRCIVWNQINQLRAPVDRLRAYHPSLAGRFLQVGRALEASAYRQQESTAISQAITPQTITIQEETHAHVQLAGDWDRILAEIRAIPGFHDFLQPPNASYLLSRLPQEGPIVIFNIGQKRSDALALVSGRDTPLHVALENFSHEQVLGLSGTLRQYLRTHDIQRDDEDLEVDRSGHKVPPLGMQGSLYKVLGSLWANAVKPILDALGFSQGLMSDRPRIWWCPTGPLAFLPLHAAGIFARDRTARSSTSDLVVSSYTPSISSLLDKLNETPTDRRKHDNLLLVSQPETPGRSRLPGAKKETEALETMMSNQSIEYRLLEGAAATATRVKEELITHNWVHFACHAVQDIAEPLNSGFHLHNGRLQLLEIMQERLSKTDHAFLSACQTSMGDEKLSDEAIHLAAGMLAAGYRGVVATMWSIQDKYGPEIATTFYSHLLEEGRSPTSEEGVSVTKLGGAGAGRALDFSTQKIRETLGDGERALLAWLPYVHFGV